MSLSFLTAYYNIIFVLIFGTASAFLAIHTAGAVGKGLEKRQVPRILLGFTAIMAVWYALVTNLAHQGIMGQGLFPGSPPLIAVFFIGGALFLYALGTQINSARVVIDRIGQEYFLGFQSFRLLGIVFVIGGFTGQIPWIFALPAGLGDMWAGYLGYRAMKAVNSGDPEAEKKVKQANFVGLVDFAIALGTGLITSETIYQLTAHDAPNLVGAFPLVLIPGLLVPMFAAAHLLSIRALRRKSSEVLGASAA